MEDTELVDKFRKIRAQKLLCLPTLVTGIPEHRTVFHDEPEFNGS